MPTDRPLVRDPVARQPIRDTCDRVYKEPPRPATVIDLVFDLAFSNALSQLGTAFVDEEEEVPVMRYFALFFPIFWHWDCVSRYLNRYDPEDYLHEIFLVTSMALVNAMSTNAVACAKFLQDPDGYEEKTAGRPGWDEWDDRCTGFAYWYMIVRLLFTFMLLRAAYYNPESMRHLISTAVHSIVGSVLWVVSFERISYDASPSAFVASIYMAVVFELGMLLGAEVKSTYLGAIVPLNVGYYEGRLARFILISMSAIISAGTTLSEEDVSNNASFYLVIMTACVISYLFKVLYFDVSDSKGGRRHAIQLNVYKGFLWHILHIPFLGGVLLMGATTELLLRDDDWSNHNGRRLFGWASATAMWALVVMGFLHVGAGKGERMIRRRIRLSSRAVTAFVIFIFPLTPLNDIVDDYAFFFGTTILIAIQVCVEVYGCRFTPEAIKAHEEYREKMARALADVPPPSKVSTSPSDSPTASPLRTDATVDITEEEDGLGQPGSDLAGSQPVPLSVGTKGSSTRLPLHQRRSLLAAKDTPLIPDLQSHTPTSAPALSSASLTEPSDLHSLTPRPSVSNVNGGSVHGADPLPTQSTTTAATATTTAATTTITAATTSTDLSAQDMHQPLRDPASSSSTDYVESEEEGHAPKRLPPLRPVVRSASLPEAVNISAAPGQHSGGSLSRPGVLGRRAVGSMVSVVRNAFRSSVSAGTPRRHQNMAHGRAMLADSEHYFSMSDESPPLPFPRAVGSRGAHSFSVAGSGSGGVGGMVRAAGPSGEVEEVHGTGRVMHVSTARYDSAMMSDESYGTPPSGLIADLTVM